MADITAQLVEQVNTARTEGKSLNIVGRGSKAFYGRHADGRHARGEAIAVTAHQGIVSYQPQELVLTARAGTSLAEINAVLQEQGQMLSFEPPGFGADASIGGTLACNQSGPSRPWRGSVRDMVLGLRLINGNGEQLRFGGQVMKNVAGYDVSRLQAGAMGCLGIITEVSIKVMPRPAASLSLVSECDSAQRGIEIINRLSCRSLPLTGACWLQGKLYLRFAGAAAAVESAATGICRDYPGTSSLPADNRFWSQLREQQLEFFSGDSPLWRFSVGSSLSHLLPGADWLIDWGGAQRWLRSADHSLQSLNELVPAGRGEVCGFRHGDRSGEVFPPMAAPLQALHQRLKAAFDPARLFNPGRMYAWL
ncbi:MAG: glycolate oxidase subunit GlcE [Gammaproteobacteria bacterium]|nr:glycolate oxidase subunit GlcE [Gammaproteobacteria bacterium]